MNDLPKKPIYEIRVKGRLADHFLKWFEGLSFEYREGDTYIVGLFLTSQPCKGCLSPWEIWV